MLVDKKDMQLFLCKLMKLDIQGGNLAFVQAVLLCCNSSSMSSSSSMWEVFGWGNAGITLMEEMAGRKQHYRKRSIFLWFPTVGTTPFWSLVAQSNVSGCSSRFHAIRTLVSPSVLLQQSELEYWEWGASGSTMVK